MVENVIGQTKQFAVASAVFRQLPELQALVLVVCFELVAEKNQANEMRYFPMQ